VGLALVLPLGACAHPVARQSPQRAEAKGHCEAVTPAESSEPGALYEVVFRMQTSASRSGAWTALSNDLEPFALGPWECAVGPVQGNDSFEQGSARIERVRRLACTHETGATVQTELRCDAPQPLAPHAAAGLRRELSLTLSAAPSLRLACELQPAERLGTVRPSSGTTARPADSGRTPTAQTAEAPPSGSAAGASSH
jgi:hypothetical protein